MAILVSAVISRVQKRLQDEVGFVFDVATELLPLLNNSLSEIVWRNPYASVLNASFATVAGIKQVISADAVALINVKRNMGVDGNTTGNIITNVPRDHLDAARPSWPTDTAAAPVHYIFDDRDPRRFYLWPQPPHPWYVELEYAQAPDDVVLTDNYPLPAQYQTASEAYIISRALARRDEEMMGTKGTAIMQLIEYWTGEFDKLVPATVATIAAQVPRNKVGRP